MPKTTKGPRFNEGVQKRICESFGKWIIQVKQGSLRTHSMEHGDGEPRELVNAIVAAD